MSKYCKVQGGTPKVHRAAGGGLSCGFRMKSGGSRVQGLMFRVWVWRVLRVGRKGRVGYGLTGYSEGCSLTSCLPQPSHRLAC